MLFMLLLLVGSTTFECNCNFCRRLHTIGVVLSGEVLFCGGGGGGSGWCSCCSGGCGCCVNDESTVGVADGGCDGCC